MITHATLHDIHEQKLLIGLDPIVACGWWYSPISPDKISHSIVLVLAHVAVHMVEHCPYPGFAGSGHTETTGGIGVGKTEFLILRRQTILLRGQR